MLSKTQYFLGHCDEGVTENSSERGEEKFDVSQWENLQIRKVFSRASLRTGLNDARELDFEKEMRWEGVSAVFSFSALNEHLILKGSEWPRRLKFFLTSLSDTSGVFCHSLISDFWIFSDF
jgi:hypothetical protein